MCMCMLHVHVHVHGGAQLVHWLPVAPARPVGMCTCMLVLVLVHGHVHAWFGMAGMCMCMGMDAWAWMHGHGCMGMDAWACACGRTGVAAAPPLAICGDEVVEARRDVARGTPRRAVVPALVLSHRAQVDHLWHLRGAHAHAHFTCNMHMHMHAARRSIISGT